ncbi:hypothetical protein EK904_014369, partial [Melospiza melodia maxima]
SNIQSNPRIQAIHPAKELESVCNLEENSSCRELRVTEEDSQSSLMQLLRKKKEVQEMEKVMAEKEELHLTLLSFPSLCMCMCGAGGNHQKCEELRIQALKTDRKQREENLKMDGELLRAKMELETLRKRHRKLCKKVQKYSIFKKYLEDVVEVSQVSLDISEIDHSLGERLRKMPKLETVGNPVLQFEDISEVISEYVLLVRTRKDLLQSQQGHKQLTEQDKVFLEQYKAQKEAEMLQYQNELGQLKLRVYQAQSDIPLWEARWADIQDRTSKKTRKLWTIKLAIHNLFQSANLRLQAQGSALECTSSLQLSMVKPSQKEEQ